MIPKIKNKPPGRRFVKKMSLDTKYKLLGLSGFVLISIGFSTFASSIGFRNSGADTAKWMLLGIYSLIMVNGGLFCLGQAVRFRVMIDTNKKARNIDKEFSKRLRSIMAKNKNVSNAKTAETNFKEDNND